MQPKSNTPYSLRIKTDHRSISFQDALQNKLCHNLAKLHGDFILKRKDRIIAYQLAVAVDDHQQNITEVVRGVDLLPSTIKQIYLQQQLQYQTPQYMHVPIIIDQQGHKLSKQTFAQAIDIKNPSQVLFALLNMLKQQPPANLKNAPVIEQLDWAIMHWNARALKAKLEINFQ